MRKTLPILLLALLLPVVAASAKPPRQLRKNAGLHYLDDHFLRYDSLQKQLHGLAETGYREFRSAELLCRHLEQHGFRVERGVAGIPTAFIATFGEGGPVIGVMAEYDALPGMAQDTVPSAGRRQAAAPGTAAATTSSARAPWRGPSPSRSGLPKGTAARSGSSDARPRRAAEARPT